MQAKGIHYAAAGSHVITLLSMGEMMLVAAPVTEVEYNGRQVANPLHSSELVQGSQVREEV